MARMLTLRLETHVLSTDRWCDDCRLPSVVHVAVVTVRSLTRVLDLAVCTDCHRQERIR